MLPVALRCAAQGGPPTPHTPTHPAAPLPPRPPPALPPSPHTQNKHRNITPHRWGVPLALTHSSASSVASRRSQAVMRSSPAPTQCPCTAATTGTGQRSNALIASCSTKTKRLRAAGGGGGGGGGGGVGARHLLGGAGGAHAAAPAAGTKRAARHTGHYRGGRRAQALQKSRAADGPTLEACSTPRPHLKLYRCLPWQPAATASGSGCPRPAALPVPAGPASPAAPAGCPNSAMSEVRSIPAQKFLPSPLSTICTGGRGGAGQQRRALRVRTSASSPPAASSVRLRLHFAGRRLFERRPALARLPCRLPDPGTSALAPRHLPHRKRARGTCFTHRTGAACHQMLQPRPQLAPHLPVDCVALCWAGQGQVANSVRAHRDGDGGEARRRHGCDKLAGRRRARLRSEAAGCGLVCQDGWMGGPAGRLSETGLVPGISWGSACREPWPCVCRRQVHRPHIGGGPAPHLRLRAENITGSQTLLQPALPLCRAGAALSSVARHQARPRAGLAAAVPHTHASLAFGRRRLGPEGSPTLGSLPPWLLHVLPPRHASGRGRGPGRAPRVAGTDSAGWLAGIPVYQPV